MLEEGVERFHQLDNCDVRTIVDELAIGVGGIGPAPSVSEGVELRLADSPGWLAKEDVVISVRVKRRIEIDKIDACVGKLFPIGKPFQIVAEIEAVHEQRKKMLYLVRNDNWVRSAGHGELHLSRLFDDLRGLENFEADDATIVAEIGNDAGANLVAFLHARVAKRDGERVRFPVIFSFHAVSYFPHFDVL